MESKIDKPLVVVKKQYLTTIAANETVMVTITDNMSGYGYTPACAVVASDNAGIPIQVVAFNELVAYIRNTTGSSGSGMLKIIWVLS